ncbi:putative heterokaryon incompatibility protein HET-C [Dioszegia hungarica]|uniref:Heterokaryon incompatibility protein HET-C n=1 Tax=Dioszegia hungarica TaxID=4972 RepID=A0AA38HGM5_9TREE|nr:putative heterokaryon incompatibility protein HET-C [Dioszegia hungarica]KAI9638574.1 putative heterokaryon incompatibility protein HET-C [Dioszegia hungarica]
MPNTSTLLILLVCLIALSFIPTVAAFGAGNIPSYSYLEGKAFRHGDIEDALANMAKAAGGGFLGRNVKFTNLDKSRVYFGNWLRDYSQAVDVGALKKTGLQTIITTCCVLGFLAHGSFNFYFSCRFEVTKESLGCYRPEEHIDNPKGYGEGEDARKYDPRLRGPVDDRELQIDPRTGMKNYIANESGGWATSSALVRNILTQCIAAGRRFRQTGDKADSYVSFQLLGRALHTLEDFSAHSNFVEVALVTLGYSQVFTHVGTNVRIQAPNGKQVSPMVTGTFGGADFIHSLMSEAGDHLSQASISDLSKSMDASRSGPGDTTGVGGLISIFKMLPGNEGDSLTRDMNDIQNMRSAPGGMDPQQMSPQELHAQIWKVLTFRDAVMKRIDNFIDRVPGLSALTEKLGNSIAVFVLQTIEPFVKPLVGNATAALGQGSQAVIDSNDQEIVWHDANSSDPTHSFLSKDHFNGILNEPAGKIAQKIVEYTVGLVVKAWDNPGMDPREVTEPVLECLFHPDFAKPHSQIQRLMLDTVRQWIDEQGSNKQETLRRLTSDSVQNHKNIRIGAKDEYSGHVHNSIAGEGGLQGMLASHNVHVPGNQVLNAGQDLMSGKMPWQQGFGSGGQHAWRGIDESGSQPLGQPSGGYDSTPSYGQHQGGAAAAYLGGGDVAYGQNQPHTSYDGQGQGQHHQGSYQQGGYNSAPSYDQNQGGQYGHSQGGYGGGEQYGQQYQQHQQPQYGQDQNQYGGGGGGYNSQPQHNQGGYGQQGGGYQQGGGGGDSWVPPGGYRS